MKIVFICSALEPGRDGVGDYCRRLAGQLILNGHQATILALNDKFIQQNSFEQQEGIQVMRMAPAKPYDQRVAEAKKWVNEFNADWLSLQFVTFGFHPKGLQKDLGKALKVLGEDRKWHILFHELWVGMDTQATLKHRLWGWLQKRLIRLVIKELNPVVIQSQTRLYQVLLQKLGYSAGFLPLFGNIPQVVGGLAKDDVLRFVVFGNIHYGAPVNQFAAEAVAWSRQHNWPIQVSFMGHCGGQQAVWVAALKAAGVVVDEMGSLSAEEISRQLQKADVGITSTPLLLVQKSGTVAAMRDHELPVICVARPWEVKGIDGSVIDKSIYDYQPGNLARFLDNRNMYKLQPRPVSEIAQQLIDSLNGKF